MRFQQDWRAKSYCEIYDNHKTLRFVWFVKLHWTPFEKEKKNRQRQTIYRWYQLSDNSSFGLVSVTQLKDIHCKRAKLGYESWFLQSEPFWTRWLLGHTALISCGHTAHRSTSHFKITPTLCMNSKIRTYAFKSNVALIQLETTCNQVLGNVSAIPCFAARKDMHTFPLHALVSPVMKLR